jgi:ActR/RegA family two-component response regulator
MPVMTEKIPKLPEDERSTLLLVDDDDVFRRVLARALNRRGYAVSVAATVDEALASALEQPPEYAVVDLKMPGPSGLVLIEKLIELDPNTRVVMLTGYASIATAIEAIKLGAIHYLAKPCDADQVVAALNKGSAGRLGDSRYPARRCRSIGWSGSISSASWPSSRGMSRPPRAP